MVIRYADAHRDRIRSDYRYVVLFRLNQIVEARPSSADPWVTRKGTFAVLDRTFPFERPPTRFGGRIGCLAIVIPKGGQLVTDDIVVPALDRLRVGQRVKVTVQPLTRNPDGTPTPSQRIVRRPRLMIGDIRFEGAEIKRALRELGCRRRPLPLF